MKTISIQNTYGYTVNGQRVPSASESYKQEFRASYDAATDYRIFIRSIDEETREVTHEFFNSYTTFEAADAARYAVRRDEKRYLFVLPGDADPKIKGMASAAEAQDERRIWAEVDARDNG